MTMTSAPPVAPLRRPNEVPVAAFAVVMGLAGLTLAWREAHRVFALPGLVADGLVVATVALFALALGACAVKAVRARSGTIEELRRPGRAAFVHTVSISVLVIAILLARGGSPVAELTWALGAAIQLGVTLHVVRAWMYRGEPRTQQLDATWFIPVLGNLLVPIAGVAHGRVEISWFFLATGMLLWVALTAVVFSGIAFHAPLPTHLAPTLFMVIGPPAVAFIAYTELSGGLDTLGRLLYHGSLFLALLLLTQLERLFHLDFAMSWWTYSFPMAAMALASTTMYRQTGALVFELAAFAFLVVASLAAIGLVVRTVSGIAAREPFADAV